MERQPVTQRDPSPLARVKEGMQVYDMHGDKIGSVERVHFGADSQAGVGAATPSAPGERDRSFVDMFADIFRDDEVPEAVSARLMQHGFIRIDSAGLFAADRYVMSDQVARVDSHGVHLSVARDDLPKP